MPSFHGGTKYWSETKGYYINFLFNNKKFIINNYIFNIINII